MGKNKIDSTVDLTEQKPVATTEMLLAKKGLIEKAPEPFYSELLDALITVENTHAESFADMISQGVNNETYGMSRLIYENCPIFRDPKLLEDYEVEDPYLLPKTFYRSNVVEFFQLGNYILRLYGYNDGRVQNIKKK